jgi:hypothetical protein
MNEAKKEAKELIDRFIDFIPCNDYELSEKEMYLEQLSNAKQCALICVDRELASLWSVGHSFISDRLNELKEVKQEIEKL